MSQQEPGIIHPPTESTPLLADNTSAEDGVVPSADSVAAEANGSDVPLLQEPTLKELLLIMSSVWVGVIFAALGMGGHQTFPFLSFKNPFILWISKAKMLQTRQIEIL